MRSLRRWSKGLSLIHIFEGQKTLTYQSAGEIYNPEAWESKPYIKLYGSGNITLSVGGQTWRVTGVSEYIEIDSEAMLCSKGQLPQNSKLHGDGFPTFPTGWSTIMTTGNVQKIEIIPRWCTL